MRLRSFILFLIVIIIAAVLLQYSIYDNNYISCLLIIPGLLIGFILSIIVHETGHLITGLLSGYKFVSFKVLFVKIYRKNRINVVFERFYLSVPGQCLMKPTNRKFFLYNLGGLIFTYSFSILMLLVMYICTNNYIVQLSYGIFIINTMLGILNSIYSKDGINDICNIIRCRNNKDYLEAVLYQLDVVSNISIDNKFRSKYNPSDDVDNVIANQSIYRFRYLKAYNEKNIDKMEYYYKLIKKSYSSISILILKVPVLIILLNHEFMIKKDVSLVKRRINRISSKEMKFISKTDEIRIINFYKNNVVNKEELNDDLFDAVFVDDPIDLFDRLSNKMYKTIQSIYLAYVRNGYKLGE